MEYEDLNSSSARCCPSCGWEAETRDEWAHHMVREHDVSVWQDDDGNCFMDYPAPWAKA